MSGKTILALGLLISGLWACGGTGSSGLDSVPAGDLRFTADAPEEVRAQDTDEDFLEVQEVEAEPDLREDLVEIQDLVADSAGADLIDDAGGDIGEDGSGLPGELEGLEPSATPGPWSIPEDVLAAGREQGVAYDYPPRWNDGEGCADGLLPGTEILSQYMAAFPGVSSVGGFSCRQNSANPTMTSVHGTGRALDIMVVMVDGEANNGQGDGIAHWLITHAAEIGIQYIIWDYSAWQGWDGQLIPYTGPLPHDDHLHVELTDEGAAMETLWFQ